MGVLKLGTVALDGTKIHANASRHSALSYERACQIEAQLKAEVADLLGRAEAADQADVPDGMSIPEELARREKRLAAIAAAKAVVEARAREHHAREQAEHDATMAQRAAKRAATGKKPGGRVPQPPAEGPLPADQVNLTDEQSRIMPVASGGFEPFRTMIAAICAPFRADEETGRKASVLRRAGAWRSRRIAPERRSGWRPGGKRPANTAVLLGSGG